MHSGNSNKGLLRRQKIHNPILPNIHIQRPKEPLTLETPLIVSRNPIRQPPYVLPQILRIRQVGGGGSEEVVHAFDELVAASCIPFVDEVHRCLDCEFALFDEDYEDVVDVATGLFDVERDDVL